jgi:hypothetical protein
MILWCWLREKSGNSPINDQVPQNPSSQFRYLACNSIVIASEIKMYLS